VNLVYDQSVSRENVAILEPSPRNSGGDDDDIPRRCLGCRFPLAIDDAYTEILRSQNFFRDWTNGESLSGARPGNDSKSLPCPRQVSNLLAMLLLENRFDVKVEGQLDGLARGASWGNDDDAASRRLRGDECRAIRRKVLISYLSHCRGKVQETGRA
jgi:hypothetical protein